MHRHMQSSIEARELLTFDFSVSSAVKHHYHTTLARGEGGYLYTEPN